MLRVPLSLPRYNGALISSAHLWLETELRSVSGLLITVWDCECWSEINSKSFELFIYFFLFFFISFFYFSRITVERLTLSDIFIAEVVQQVMGHFVSSYINVCVRATRFPLGSQSSQVKLY